MCRSLRYLLFCWLLISLTLETRAQLSEIAALKDRLESAISPLEQATIYNQLGMLYTMRTLDSCYLYTSRGLELSKRIRDKRSEAEAMNVLGFYYMEVGNPYLAYKFVNESLNIFRRLGDRERICELTMNVGVLLGMEGKTEQALAQLQDAYQQSSDLANDSIRAMVLLNLTAHQGMHVPYFQLAPLFDEAVEIARRHNDQRTLLSIQHTRSLIRFDNGWSADSTLSEQKELIQNARRYGLEYLLIRGNFEIGYIYLRNHPDSAEIYFDQAIELAGEMGFDGLRYHLIGRAYGLLDQLRPRPPKADKYGADLLEIGRQRYIDHENEGFSFMELAIKETELKAQHAQYRLRRTLMWGGLLVALLSVLSVVLIYRQYRVTRRLVRDLRTTNAEFSRTNERLEQNDDFHKKVIAILSHDLRQPFAAIQMFSDRMLEDLDRDDLHLIFDEMRQSATISLQVMDGLLHWMKAETTGSGEGIAAVPVYESMRLASEFNDLAIRRRNITLEIRIDSSLRVFAQHEMLLFVNRNILHNAVKYTPEGGKISISANVLPAASGKKGEQELVVRVSDTGPGIPEDILMGLFKKDVFSIPEHSPNRRKMGAGLALIICFEMMEKMGATLWAENNTDGPGASFYYRLPCVTVDP